MDAATRFDTQIVGSLPVITEYLDRLGIADAVNSAVPWEGDVPLGTLVEVMVCNRLLNPKALFRVDDWAQTAAVADYFELEPGQLNDDRLGRALERLATHADKVQGALVLSAIKHFQLDVTQIHYDITDVELFGAYELEVPEGETPPTPMPAYGRTKSGRKNVKQIQLGMNVTGDGGVPVAHMPLDGNAGESPTHLENLRRFAGHAAQAEAVVHCRHEVGYAGELAACRRARWSIPLRRRLRPTREGAVSPSPPETSAGGLPSQESGAFAARGTR